MQKVMRSVRRGLAVFLSLLMVFSMGSVNVSAAEMQETTTEETLLEEETPELGGETGSSLEEEPADREDELEEFGESLEEESAETNGEATENEDSEAADLSSTDEAQDEAYAAEESAWDGKTQKKPKIENKTAYIYTPEELAWTAKEIGSYSAPRVTNISLEADINLGSYPWTEIGKHKSRAFKGNFEGNGHTITGLYIVADGTTSQTCYTGLFGYATGAVFQNVNVEGNILVTKADDTYGPVIGGLLGFGKDITVSDVNCDVDILLPKDCEWEEYISSSALGGIAGYAEETASGNGTVFKNCVNKGDITAEVESPYIGGIIGESKNCSLEECENLGNLTGIEVVGGLVGNYGQAANKNTRITNSYNAGELRMITESSTTLSIGGILGCFSEYNTNETGVLSISEVYNKGTIVVDAYTGDDPFGSMVDAGGIIGTNWAESSQGEAVTISRAYTVGDMQVPGYNPKGDEIGAFMGSTYGGRLTNVYALEGICEQLYVHNDGQGFEVQATDSGFKSREWLQSGEALKSLGSGFTADRNNENDGYPVLAVGIPADYTAVEAALAKIPEDLSVFTEETVRAVTEAKEAVEYGLDAAQQSRVDAMAEALEKAIAGLEYKKADYTAVNEALKKVPEDLSIYTEETAKAVKDAVDAVVWDKNITQQAEVDAMAKAIEDAVAGLEERDPEKEFQEVMPEVTARADGESVIVSWKAIPNAKSYRIYRKEAGGSFKGLTNAAEGTTSLTDTTAEAGVTYYYTVKGFWEENAKGTATKYPTDVSVKIPVTSLKTPSVSTRSVNYCTVDISWNKITGAEKYVIYRKEAKAGTAFKSIGTVSSGTLKYRDGTAKMGVKYYYTVKAYAGSIYSDYQKTVTGMAVPSSPALKASGSTKGVTVTWTGSKAGANRFADGYRIFRKTENGSWKTVGTVGKNTRSYTDTTGKKGTTYDYTVRAYVKQSNGTNLWGTYNSAGVKGAKK